MTTTEQANSRKAPNAKAQGPNGPNTAWRDSASCRYTAPELFFPAGSTGAAIEEIQAAKAVCQTCQVRNACLQFALETNQEAGIWGGTTEDERPKLRRAWLANRRRQTMVTS